MGDIRWEGGGAVLPGGGSSQYNIVQQDKEVSI